jgi:signal peptidase I
LRDGDRPEPSLPGRFLRWLRSRRVVVVDGSMVPTLLPGDRLRVDPSAYRDRPPAVGEIVVLADPEGRVRWLVKRVSAVRPDEGAFEVSADAAVGARDSRSFGAVPRAALAGRAYQVYHPPDRRRAL